MTFWFALPLLILLSANAVFSNDYVDELIDNDPYLSRCITSTGINDRKGDGVKKIHSGPECNLKFQVKFKVESIGYYFLTSYKQGEGLVAPAKIRYKFGDCYDIVIKIKKKNDGTIKYSIHDPNNPISVGFDDGFVFAVKRDFNQDQNPDQMMVLTNATEKGIPVFSEPCKAFEKDPQDDKVPTLMLFEQEILQGVPDFTLVWDVFDSDKGYFGTAYARNIVVSTTTKSITTSTKISTSTIAPTTVTSTTTETSTIAPTTVNSNSSLSTTDATETDEMSNWWFISVIIVEFVIILLLVLALIVACLVIRRLTREIALFDADMKSTANRVQSER